MTQLLCMKKNPWKWRPFSIWLIFFCEKGGNHHHTLLLSARQEKVHLQYKGNCWIPLQLCKSVKKLRSFVWESNFSSMQIECEWLSACCCLHGSLHIKHTRGFCVVLLFSRKCIRRLWDLSYFFRLIPLFKLSNNLAQNTKQGFLPQKLSSHCQQLIFCGL